MTNELLGRDAELRRVDDLVASSATVHLVGPPRAGRTALLQAWSARAAVRVVRLDGVADEAGLPGAGLDRLRRSLGGATLHETLGDDTTVCVVDDADLVDDLTLRALLAAAGEQVRVVLATAGDPRLAGVPAVAIGPLRATDAVQVLVGLAPGLDPVWAARLVARTDRRPGTITALAQEVRRRGPCAPELLTLPGPGLGSAGPGRLRDAARDVGAARLAPRPPVETLLGAARVAHRAGATVLAAGWLAGLDAAALDDRDRLRALVLRPEVEPERLLAALEDGHAAGDLPLGRDVAERALAGSGASYAGVAERLHRVAGAWDDGGPGSVVARAAVAVGRLPLADALPIAREALRTADLPLLARACWEHTSDRPDQELHTHLARGDHEAAYGLAAQALATAPAALRGPLLADAIEAATGSGRPEVADRLLAELAEVAATVDRPWARGVLARCRALREPGSTADLLDLAIAELGTAGARLDLARTHLLAGEWLRRRRMRAEATAHLVLAAAGLRGHPLAERARRELEVLRSPAAGDGAGLTHQERVVARLAASGRSNLDIGRSLAISRHTVDHHLRQVYRKLEVAGRHQLGALLGAGQ